MTDCGCGAWRLRIPKNLRDNKIGDVQFVCIWHCMSHVSQIYVFFLSFFFVFLIAEGSAGEQKTLTYTFLARVVRMDRNRDERAKRAQQNIDIDPRAFFSPLSSVSSIDSSRCRSIPYLSIPLSAWLIYNQTYRCLIIIRSACNI